MREDRYRVLRRTKRLQKVLQRSSFGGNASRVLFVPLVSNVSLDQIGAEEGGGTNLSRGVESLVRRIKVLIQLEYARYVPASVPRQSLVQSEGEHEPVAVIRGRPNGDDGIVKHQLESLHHLLLISPAR